MIGPSIESLIWIAYQQVRVFERNWKLQTISRFTVNIVCTWSDAQCFFSGRNDNEIQFNSKWVYTGNHRLLNFLLTAIER